MQNCLHSEETFKRNITEKEKQQKDTLDHWDGQNPGEMAHPQAQCVLFLLHISGLRVLSWKRKLSGCDQGKV